MIETSTSRADLVSAFTTALAFSSTDTTIPPLCGVQLSIHKNRLVLAATDRFKAAIIRVDLDAETKIADQKLGFVEHAAARKILAYIKTAGSMRKLPVPVEIRDGAIAFAGGDGSRFVHTLSGIADKGPNVLTLVQKHIAAEHGSAEWSANADYLAKFRVAKRSSGEHISLRPTANGRGIIAVIGDHFLGLLMPVRETTPLDDRLAEWQKYLNPSPKPRAARKAAAPRKAAAKKAAPRRSKKSVAA